MNAEKFHNYTITDDGRVFSWTGHELRQRVTPKGYKLVTLNTEANGRGRGWFVHRLVATLFVVNPMPSVFTQVNHIDGNPANNQADNLEWVDNRTNKAHGRHLRNHQALNRLGRTKTGLQAIRSSGVSSLGFEHSERTRAILAANPSIVGGVGSSGGLQDNAQRARYRSFCE